MFYTITNDNLHVKINTKGAEISSILYKNTEYLWQADATFWGKHAPILFPIVGRLPRGKTFINDSIYEIERHGFIKYFDFNVIFLSNDKIILKSTYTAESLIVFPFKFNVIIEYSVKNNKFTQKSTIENLDKKEMVYNFGLHPAFNIASEKYAFDDYYLDFNENLEINKPTLTEDFMLDFNKRKKVAISAGKLPLTHSLFDDDAIVIDNLKSNKVSLYNKNDEKVFDFEFCSNFNLIAFWQPAGAPFVCFEPWAGLGGVHPDPILLKNNHTSKFLQPLTSTMYNITITF